MREFERINRICSKLEVLWSKVPDQRFGQFLNNYILQEGRNAVFLEDDKLEKIIDYRIEKGISLGGLRKTADDEPELYSRL